MKTKQREMANMKDEANVAVWAKGQNSRQVSYWLSLLPMED
jgi:hypothetical protein